MGFRLTNQSYPKKTLRLNRPTWYGILDLAVENGWNPMGTAHPEWWLLPGEETLAGDGPSRGGYTGEPLGLVLLEDALNLADALEQALLAYEPEWQRFRVWGEKPLQGDRGGVPSLGAMSCLVVFCRIGSFHIEHLH